MNHPTNDLVPTSSPPRPARGDDLRNRPRPSSPSPLGDEVELASTDEDTINPSTSSHGTRSNPNPFNPGTTWLITHRTHPAWTAVLHLLDDDQWHPLTEIHHAMRTAADLAPRTIENHLRSAVRRRWLTKRRNHIRLLDRQAVETALDAVSPKDGAR